MKRAYPYSAYQPFSGHRPQRMKSVGGKPLEYLKALLDPRRTAIPLLFRGTRYMVVSWIGMVVNTACLYLFKGVLRIPIIPASMMAIEIAIIHNFVWYRNWAWRDRREQKTQLPFFRQLLLYNVATGLVDLLVNVSILWLLYRFFGVYYLIANIIGMILGPFIKFWLNDKIIFKEKR
jgi:dolichol-phosphate mannosyltransferase